MKKKSAVVTSKRIRRSPEQWQAILTAYESSGKTQQAFCKQQVIATSLFAKWRKRLNHSPKARTHEPLFMELPSSGYHQTKSSWDIELELGRDLILRLRQNRC